MRSKNVTRFAAAFGCLLLAGCGGSSTAGGPPPPEVAVQVVQPAPLELTTELPGRLEASRVAEVRARVPGIVLERVFEEGSQVEADQLLYRIDPAPFRANYDRAVATRSRAEATLNQATLRAERYAPLVETRAVSPQDYDDAIAARDAAAADLALARAAVQTARLDLEYTTVRAPIAGRIGRAQVTEGALVGQGQATHLATIQQIDPLYLNLTQSSAEVLQMRRALASGALNAANEVLVSVVTEDGHPHPHTGTLLFTDISVDASTGSVQLRAQVPNPERALLPGMYVRATLHQGSVPDALVVPQQALIRDDTGTSVRLVNAENLVEVRQVTVGEAHGNNWHILDGLQPGERVVVEGIQRAGPGRAVTPVPWTPAGTH